MTFDCVVVGSHLRFDGVWQRPQQIVTRLAHRVPVLFIEEPLASPYDRDEITERAKGTGVTTLRPRRRAPAAEVVDPKTLDCVRTWLAGRHPLIWLYTPMMLALAATFPEAPVVFDCMDELAAFDFAPPELLERERVLSARANLIFCGGRSLYEKYRSLGDRVRLCPSGVEYDHFASARTIAPHGLFANLSRPICGYVGVIDERIDIDALERLADRAASVALVGPIAKIEPAILPRRTNVHFSGAVDYALLPAMLAGFDVAMMPFARNAATAHISPTKTPEYLAAGKPVVSTRIADVVASYGEVVTIADDPESFADACVAAAVPDAARVAAGIVRAQQMSWDAIAERMWQSIEGE